MFADNVLVLPSAVADSVLTSEETATTIDVTANDLDAQGTIVPKMNGTSITQGGAAVAAANGSVVLNAADQLVLAPEPRAVVRRAHRQQVVHAPDRRSPH